MPQQYLKEVEGNLRQVCKKYPILLTWKKKLIQSIQTLVGLHIHEN